MRCSLEACSGLLFQDLAKSSLPKTASKLSGPLGKDFGVYQNPLQMHH